jgi:hypothetical protein
VNASEPHNSDITVFHMFVLMCKSQHTEISMSDARAVMQKAEEWKTAQAF